MESINTVEIDSPEGKLYRKWCVVYDYRTGAVMHIHQNIAPSKEEICPPNKLAEDAIKQATNAMERVPIDLACDKEFLKVGHPSEDTPLEPDIYYYVDLESNKVLWKRVPQPQMYLGKTKNC